MANLTRLDIQAGTSTYPTVVGRGAIRELPALLDERKFKGRLRILADERIVDPHGQALLDVLESAGRPAELFTISGQEQQKTLAQVAKVYDWLVEVGTDRSDLVVALGGGVVGDLVGFAAATYLRGVRLVQIPTTVLAMVDSSIGGKTGVDHPAGKNLIGAFYQPQAVIADLDFLATLPRREIVNGWAEVIKMGVIRSPELFERLEADSEAMLNLEPAAAWAIGRAIELKGEVVAADEREADLRMILNYGHTIGHAIEAATEFGRYLHGEAVAIGMTGAAAIARRLDMFSDQEIERQAALLARFGLPSACPGLSPDQIRRPLRHDKKAVGSRLRWVLPERIGAVRIVDDVPDPLVDETLAWLAQA